jgi:hypothetical protein
MCGSCTNNYWPFKHAKTIDQVHIDDHEGLYQSVGSKSFYCGPGVDKYVSPPWNRDYKLAEFGHELRNGAVETLQ